MEPSAVHYLGTDNLGRDIFFRIIFALRHTFEVSTASVFLSAIVGLTIGFSLAFSRSWINGTIIRLVDVWIAFPSMILVLVIKSLLWDGKYALILAIMIAYIPVFTKTSKALGAKELGEFYVKSVFALGAGKLHIFWKHILPNTSTSLVTLATSTLSDVIVIESTLSFLGVGVSPLTPTLGGMINLGVRYIGIAPHITLFPALTITILILSVHLIGDGLLNASAITDNRNY